MKCPECNSTRLTAAGKRWRRLCKDSTKRIRIPQYQCQDCGRTTAHPKEEGQ